MFKGKPPISFTSLFSVMKLAQLIDKNNDDNKRKKNDKHIEQKISVTHARRNSMFK